MSTHAKLSPSSAHRWLRCPASVGFIDRLRAEGKIPKEDRSAFTDEGTTAHAYAAKALEHYDAGIDFDWDAIPDKVMASHVRAYVDLVTSKITGDGQLFIEVALPLFYGDGTEHGTADAVVLTDESLFVIDLKYGEGVSVDAKENDQLAIYAESFIRKHGLRDRLPPQFSVVPTIFQPRAREGAPVREWFTSLGELEAASVETQEVADDIRHNTNCDFIPGEKQCCFCPAKKLCRHYADHCTLDVDDEFNDVIEEIHSMMPAPDELSEADIARIAKVAIDGRFVKWLNTVADYALELRQQGKLADSGLKVVASSPRRKWTDEDAASKLLRNYLAIDDAMPRSLVSPSQAEKLLKGHSPSTKFVNKMLALIEKPAGQPVLALASDERPELKPITATSEFSDVAKADEDLL